MSAGLSPIQRRVFALLFAAGEARVENGAILIEGGGELPATIIRQLITKGYLARTVRDKGRVVIRPCIGAAGKATALDKAGKATST